MSSFQFRHFIIHQDRCAMKVGTDGVLLGAWASLPHPTTPAPAPSSLLDIGTGTGIIALMLAQRTALTPTSRPFDITALEIDPTAAQQAQENVAASPWHDRITVHPLSLQAFAETCSPKKFALIVSNPPFYNATLKPTDESRAIARHKDALPVSDIARFASTHLSENGRLALIYPTAYDSEVMTAAVLSRLHPVRICDILTKVGKPSKRRMAEFSLQNAPISREQLIIRDADGKYTDDYRALTADFYLHLSD